MLRAIGDYMPASVKVNCPKGGYFLWLEFEPLFNAQRLYQLALAEGISIAPGSMFCTSEQFNHAFRLNASFDWNQEMERAMQTLGNICHILLAEIGGY